MELKPEIMSQVDAGRTGFAEGIIKQLKRFFIMLTIVLTILSCVQTGNKQKYKENGIKEQQQFFINGAYALYPMAQIWADAYRVRNPEIRISVLPASSNKGKTDVELGLAEIGMYSNPILAPDSSKLISFKVAKDAVVPTMNAGHPGAGIIKRTGITPDQFRQIFVTGQITHWHQLMGEDTGSNPVVVFTRSDASGAAAVWSEFLGVSQDRLSGIGVYGDAGMVQAIRSHTYAIGYDNLRYVYDNKTGQCYPGIFAPPVDFNNDRVISESERATGTLETMKQAIRSGEYPYPLARDLFLLVHRKQNNPHVIAFLEWVFGEGMQLIDPSGYIPIPDGEIQQERIKLEQWKKYMQNIEKQ